MGEPLTTNRGSESAARYEFKFVVPTTTAVSFVRAAESLVCADRYHESGYRVNSIYYDTSDFSCYFEKLDGVDPRLKLRLRWYGTLVEAGDQVLADALFVEVKHRYNLLVRKDRVRLRGKIPADLFESSQSLLSSYGLLAGGENVASKDLGASSAIQRVLASRAFTPVGLVRYLRRPFIGRHDTSLRVTVDTDLRALSPSGYLRATDHDGIPLIPQAMCILEIKFHTSMPLALGALCREFGLNSRRYSKYCAAVEVLYPMIARRAVRVERS